MSLHLIKTHSKHEYITQKTPKTRKCISTFQKKEMSKIHVFKKNQANQRCMLICIALCILLRATQPN